MPLFPTMVGFRGVTDDALEQLDERRSVALSVKRYSLARHPLRTSDMVCDLAGPKAFAEGSWTELASPAIEWKTGFLDNAWHERTHAIQHMLDTGTTHSHFLYLTGEQIAPIVMPQHNSTLFSEMSNQSAQLERAS